MNLCLPQCYEKLNELEMHHYEGGWTSTSTWYGGYITMSQLESQRLQTDLGTFTAVGQIGVNLLAVVNVAFVVWGLFVAYAHLLKGSLQKYTTSKGVYLHMTPALVFWSESR